MLEQIVRPFVSPETISDKRSVVISVTKSKPQRAVLTWGAVGQPPTIYSIAIKLKDKDEKWKEVSRTTTDVRVENPDDPDQFVVERRVKSMEVKKKATLLTPSGGGDQIDEGNNSGHKAGAETNTAYDKNNNTPMIDLSPNVKYIDMTPGQEVINLDPVVHFQLLNPKP